MSRPATNLSTQMAAYTSFIRTEFMTYVLKAEEQSQGTNIHDNLKSVFAFDWGRKDSTYQRSCDGTLN